MLVGLAVSLIVGSIVYQANRFYGPLSVKEKELIPVVELENLCFSWGKVKETIFHGGLCIVVTLHSACSAVGADDSREIEVESGEEVQSIILRTNDKIHCFSIWLEAEWLLACWLAKCPVTFAEEAWVS